MMRSYQCPICERTCQYEGRPPEAFPFCSNRCKMVDLGRWFRGEYAIERPVGPEDLEGAPLPIEFPVDPDAEP